MDVRTKKTFKTAFLRAVLPSVVEYWKEKFSVFLSLILPYPKFHLFLFNGSEMLTIVKYFVKV